MNQASVTPTADTADKEAPPAPTFDAIPLSSDVRKAVDTLGYTHPTPVQIAVFEPATRGKSLVVQARTGTGKTAAFGLPIIDALVKRSQPNVQALILTPTRELALQVGRELEHLAQFRGTKIVPIYGGAPMGRQIAALEEGAQVVTGTPGRVLDHLRRGTLDASNVRIFVLDEADEMLSMGFAKELNAIIGMLPKERQGLYFSATIPPDVERLANSHLREPEYITLSSDQVGALSISHFVYLVREGDKRSALARIIEVEDPESAVIFCNTREETERVAEVLKNRGYDADWLNGDLDQRERESVMARTREGKLRFLVATDVAARGIDISHLTHVINADFPESAEQYVHRTGRTGRAGKTGTAISVVGPKDVGHLYMLRLTYKIRPIERMLPTAGELRTRAEADMIAFLADAYAGKAQAPAHLAIARRLLTHDSAEIVIAGLLADHLGASGVLGGENATEEAADARRAKNPPPVPEAAREPARERRDGRPVRPERREPRAGDGEPRTLRDGEKPARPATSPAIDGRARDGRNGPVVRDAHEHGRRDPREPRREGRPHSSLSSWEPPAEKDDDKPLFREQDTKPGIGPTATPTPTATREAPPRPAAPRERHREHDRGRRGRAQPMASHEDDADTVDLHKPLPSYHVEDDPTVAFRGRTASASAEPGEPNEGAPSSRDSHREEDPNFTNVFLNVGRRDGLRTEDVQRLLTDKAGLNEADVSHIRVRDRITFVGIRNERAEAAIQALIGAAVGDRTVNAEPARADQSRRPASS